MEGMENTVEGAVRLLLWGSGLGDEHTEAFIKVPAVQSAIQTGDALQIWEQMCLGRGAAWLKENKNIYILQDGFEDLKGSRGRLEVMAVIRSAWIKQNEMKKAT